VPRKPGNCFRTLKSEGHMWPVQEEHISGKSMVTSKMDNRKSELKLQYSSQLIMLRI
jgi:hypothetical protein